MSAKIVLVRMFSPHAGDRSCDIEKQKYYLVSFQFDHFKSGSICLMHLGVWLGIEYLKNIFEMGIIPVKSSIFQFFKYLKKSGGIRNVESIDFQGRISFLLKWRIPQ